MATYKVLQDIEAEDKLIGRLTLRQFIYAAIGALFLWLSYIFASRGAGFMLVVFLPVAGAMAFFAFPWMSDQPTEVWALAKIRFALKPRRRVWNQDGLKELVTITAPKTAVVDYTNGLSQQEVRSRLRALASTIDTRGWAVKNATLNLAASGGAAHLSASDRLVAAPMTATQNPVADVDIRASDDILDEQNNSNAQRLQGMIEQKAKSHREELIASLNSETAGQQQAKQPTTNDYWFLNQPSAAAKIPNNMVTFNTQVIAPGAADDNTVTGTAVKDNEEEILAELDLHKQQSENASLQHMHGIQPISRQTAKRQVVKAPPAATSTAPTVAPQNANAPVTPQSQTAILHLAGNNDLNVATIAREAERKTSQDEGEVVVKLH